MEYLPYNTMAHTSIASSKGFTLIEMLIVLAIIGVVTVVVVTGQRSFERSVILTNTTYNIALSIREAQAYGFSGKSATSGATDAGNYAYGVDFNIALPNKNTDTYTLFADNGAVASTDCHKNLSFSGIIPPDQKVGDCIFSSNDTTIRRFVIHSGVTISDVCVYSGGLINCSSTGSGAGKLDISFTRPNSIYVFFESSPPAIIAKGDTACIKISRLGASRYILVRGYGSSIPYEAGTVSVSDTPVSPYCTP